MVKLTDYLSIEDISILNINIEKFTELNYINLFNPIYNIKIIKHKDKIFIYNKYVIYNIYVLIIIDINNKNNIKIYNFKSNNQLFSFYNYLDYITVKYYDNRSKIGIYYTNKSIYIYQYITDIKDIIIRNVLNMLDISKSYNKKNIYYKSIYIYNYISLDYWIEYYYYYKNNYIYIKKILLEQYKINFIIFYDYFFYNYKNIFILIFDIYII